MLEFYGFSFYLIRLSCIHNTYCLINTVKETRLWRVSGLLNGSEKKNNKKNKNLPSKEREKKKGFQVICVQWNGIIYLLAPVNAFQTKIWSSRLCSGSVLAHKTPPTVHLQSAELLNPLMSSFTPNVMRKYSSYRLGHSLPSPSIKRIQCFFFLFFFFFKSNKIHKQVNHWPSDKCWN